MAEACLACGSHYVDLADGRDFVQGIVALNGAAQAAGLCVISGASSVPALSGAAVDHLAKGFRQIQNIDIGISPGNRTDAVYMAAGDVRQWTTLWPISSLAALMRAFALVESWRKTWLPSASHQT